MKVIESKTGAMADHEKLFSRKDLAAHWVLLMSYMVSLVDSATREKNPSERQMDLVINVIELMFSVFVSFINPLTSSMQGKEEVDLDTVWSCVKALVVIIDSESHPQDLEKREVFNICRVLAGAIDGEMSETCYCFSERYASLYCGAKPESGPAGADIDAQLDGLDNLLATADKEAEPAPA